MINNGDYATNNPNVQIDPVWPANADQVLISNNGGFGSSGNATTFSLGAEVPWALKLKRTGRIDSLRPVYVRFLGAGMDNVNFTADIILDETAPTLQAAQLVRGGGASAALASAARAKPRHRKYRVKIKAHDSIVGICALDASAKKTGGTIVVVKNCRKKGILHLAKTVTINSTALPKYVRVRNSAGSWSRWLKLR